MDYPRFERIGGHADRLHERYHGGRLVTLVFAIADRWRQAGGHGGRLRQARSALLALVMPGMVRRLLAMPLPTRLNLEQVPWTSR